MEDILRRLAAANIELLPAAELTTHFVFTRDGFISLVERKPDGFGGIGAAGLLCDQGMAQLVWRGATPWFVTRSFEREATDAEVDLLRSFATDLKNCLLS